MFDTLLKVLGLRLARLTRVRWFWFQSSLFELSIVEEQVDDDSKQNQDHQTKGYRCRVTSVLIFEINI